MNTKQLAPIDDLRNTLTKMGSQFKMALPSHVTPEKFIRVVLTACQGSPDLLQADRTSFFAACMKSATDGLIPDGREAALVVFNKNIGTKAAPNYQKFVQFMPMVNGILKKVRNSGELASLSPHVVYKNDEFEYWIDEAGEHLKHRPKLNGERGEIAHAYAIAKTKDGAVYIEVMSYDEIEKVRNSSRAKDSGPWSQWYGEMAKKTVVRRLAKRLPMSSDLDGAIASDDVLYEPMTVNEAPVEQVQTTTPAKLEALVTSVPSNGSKEEIPI